MRREFAFLMDMLAAVDELAAFVATTAEARFLSSKTEQSFVFHRMVILGEAANAVPKELQARYPRTVGPAGCLAESFGARLFRP
jgi:uncharacterized protein with HEPN domain